MHRIDGSGHAANMFTEGNPGLGVPPTVVTDDWLNDVQENLVDVILNAGVPLTKGRAQDLRDAIVALIGVHAPVVSVPDASTTQKGVVELATGPEAAALTAANLAITPNALASVVATSAAFGLVRYATNAEVQTGTATDRGVTPAGLASLTSTTTRRGLVELATGAEAAAMTDPDRCVTPLSLASVTASTTAIGLVELATGAEAAALSDAARAITPQALASVVASTTASGLVRMATNAEAQAGSLNNVAVSPAALATVVASVTARGLVELATVAEATAGTDTQRAVTPEGLAAAVQGPAMLYGADSNASGNALTVTLTPAPNAYTAGMRVLTRANGANTGAVTVNVNGLGSKAVKRNGAALPAGAIQDGQILLLVYDGTDFQLIGGVYIMGSPASGYMVFDNGVIHQWGVCTPTSQHTGSSGEVTVGWPLTFPAAVDAILLTAMQPSGAISGGGISAYYRSATVFGASIGVDEISASSGLTTVSWFAIGR